MDPASSGRLEARLASGVSASARQAARAALNGSDPTGGAKYFKLASSGHAGTVVGTDCILLNLKISGALSKGRAPFLIGQFSIPLL